MKNKNKSGTKNLTLEVKYLIKFVISKNISKRRLEGNYF